MKYINDLAYASQIVQAKHSAKDKRQKNKYRQTVLLSQDTEEEADLTSEGDNSTDDLPIIEAENDRRKGEERRKEQQNRGRYVESRLQKNRRDKKALSVVI